MRVLYLIRSAVHNLFINKFSLDVKRKWFEFSLRKTESTCKVPSFSKLATFVDNEVKLLIELWI